MGYTLMKMVIRRRKRFRYKSEVKAGLVIIALALLIFLGIMTVRNQALPIVTLTVADLEMREDEGEPAFSVQAEYDESDANLVLDKKAGYTLEDFVADIREGKGYVIEQSANLSMAGTYPLSVKLNEEMTAKYQEGWNQKFELVFEEGTLNIKSKHGDWDGSKFLLLDGTYAKGWLNVGSDTYYFGEDNTYLTGEQNVGNRTYYFGEDGKFDNEKNSCNPNRPMIALTFDDGPGPYTMQLLETLEEHSAKATFFMLGTRVNVYPDTVKKMVEIGCELGNHTTNHAKLTELNVAGILAEINTTNQAIWQVTGQSAKYIRPPYGAVNSVVRGTVESPLIMWSLDTLDWESRDVSKIKEVVLNSIKDGDIVLLHDIHETTVQAVIELIPELKEKGYQFVTVSELADMRGTALNAGEKYFNFYK